MEKLVGMLHLCLKAGKLGLGQKAVLSLRAGEKLHLTLLSADAGAALKRKFSGNMVLTIGWSSERMGEIFGRDKLSIIGIADSGFAAEIEGMMKSEKLLVV